MTEWNVSKALVGRVRGLNRDSLMLLDPSEEKLIHTADDFSEDYRRLLDASAAANDRVMRSGNVLALTRKFRDFKQAGVEGIEKCRIRSVILPLLADHVLREANHYIRILEE